MGLGVVRSSTWGVAPLKSFLALDAEAPITTSGKQYLIPAQLGKQLSIFLKLRSGLDRAADRGHQANPLSLNGGIRRPPLPPRELSSRDRKRGSLVYAASNRSSDALGAQHANLSQISKVRNCACPRRRRCEDNVVVHRRMGGTQRQRAAILGHRCDTLELCCAQRRVGDHDHEIGARRRVGLEAKRQVIVDILGPEAEAAELTLPFIRRGPEIGAFAARRLDRPS